MVARDRLAAFFSLVAVQTHTHRHRREITRETFRRICGKKKGVLGAGQGLLSCQCALFHVAGDDRWLMTATVRRRLLDNLGILMVGFDVRFKRSFLRLLVPNSRRCYVLEWDFH